uniref:Uncharacterized protein n=1 Tax=Arundo donax TaxID=35708 RepID=A0A0A9I7V8_ARUDO
MQTNLDDWMPEATRHAQIYKICGSCMHVQDTFPGYDYLYQYLIIQKILQRGGTLSRTRQISIFNR